MTSKPTPLETVELSDMEQEILLCIAEHMIPANPEFDVPGASDPAIFADILQSIARDGAALKRALRTVIEATDGKLASLSTADQKLAIAKLRSDEPKHAAIFEAVIVRCYYRDDRVMTSIGIEVRPPFPLGYEVERGDFSLIEPVIGRGAIYRDPNTKER